jgi:hypothetical protein
MLWSFLPSTPTVGLSRTSISIGRMAICDALVPVLSVHNRGTTGKRLVAERPIASSSDDWLVSASVATNTSAAGAPFPCCAMPVIARPAAAGGSEALLASKPTKVTAWGPLDLCGNPPGIVLRCHRKGRMVVLCLLRGKSADRIHPAGAGAMKQLTRFCFPPGGSLVGSPL